MKRKLRDKKYRSEVKEDYGIYGGHRTSFDATFGNRPSGVAGAKRAAKRRRR